MKKILYFLEIIILLCSCKGRNPYYGTSYVFKNKTPFMTEFHVLSLDNANYFTYLLYSKSRTLNEKVEGEYEIKKDSLILKITNPVDYNVQKTTVEYSNYGSLDSVYFMFYELPPRVLKVNSYRYKEVSSSLIYDCPKDTCPANLAIESKVLSGWESNDIIKVPREKYISNQLDTLIFFDPNDNLIDKKIPIIVDKNNCIKVFIALKPKYDLIKIPTQLLIRKKQLIADFENKNRVYKLFYKEAVNLDK
jgi:hypothetical protein